MGEDIKTRREFLVSTAAGGIAGIIAYGVAPVFARNVGERKEISLEQAQKVHKKCLIIDGHNDTPVERVARGERSLTWMQRDMAYQTDIPRMKEGQHYLGFMIVGNGLVANVWVTSELVLEQIKAHPDDIMQVLCSRDAVRVGKSDKVGVMLSIEGIAKWLDGKIDILRMLHRIGIRLVGITHGEGGSEPTVLQGTASHYGPCTPEEREAERKNAVGLTPFGIEVLKLSNELGIVTDTAHINDKAFFDVMERSSTPPIMSHTAVFSLGRHWRCMTDDQIKALAARGGVMGITFVPEFIDPDPAMATVDRLVDHICFVADLVGIDYVGIGTDYDGGVKVPVIPEVSQLVELTRGMLARGFTEEDIQKVWGGNFLRILRQTIDRQSAGRQ